MTPVTFECAGETLFASLYEGTETTGILIVTGGAQIRSGPQRLFVRLGHDLSNKGYPVFRFDRRGIGDSDGQDAGFLDCEADIAAAVRAFRERMPHISTLIGVGLCDGATALAITPGHVDAMILLNPWIIDETAPPPPATVAAHYRRRFLQKGAWRRALSGRVNLLSTLRDLLKTARPAATGPDTLDARVCTALKAITMPVHIVLSSRDRTADAFRPVAKRLAADLASITDIDADHAFSAPDSYAHLEQLIAERARQG